MCFAVQMYVLSFTLSTAGCISGAATPWSQAVGLMRCCPCRVLVDGLHPGRKICGVDREIHLGRQLPSGGIVSYGTCLDEAISAASRQGNANTDSRGGVSLPR